MTEKKIVNLAESREIKMNIILIHGTGGYKSESYFAWLKIECEKIGLNVFIPQMPGWRDGGTYEMWRDIFDKECGHLISKETIILAQSLGTRFAVKYLGEVNKEVKAYISCAGMYDMAKMRDTPENVLRIKDFELQIPSFTVSKDEYKKFANFNFPKFSFYSDNDNFFEQSNLELYANSIDAKHILVKGKGHFSIFAGVREFPEVLEIILNLAKSSSNTLSRTKKC